MELLLELFTSPTCPHCPAAMRVAENVVKGLAGAILIERDVSLPENQSLAAQYGIQAVPTLVANKRHRIVGIPGSEKDLYSKLQNI